MDIYTTLNSSLLENSKYSIIMIKSVLLTSFGVSVIVVSWNVSSSIFGIFASSREEVQGAVASV